MFGGGLVGDLVLIILITAFINGVCLANSVTTGWWVELAEASLFALIYPGIVRILWALRR